MSSKPSRLMEHHLKTLEPFLKHGWSSRKIPPVVLLTGLHGIGKREVVRMIAQWLLCTQTGYHSPLFHPHPCGECTSCRKALTDHWVDFKEISAVSDGDPDSQSIKIDQFNDLKLTQGFGAFEGEFRITYIHNAEQLTRPAQQSLLKILEEPPPSWIFMLSAADSSLLLPTLISRCQIVRLKPLPSEVIRASLLENKVPTDRIDFCTDFAHGSLSDAFFMASDKIWEKHDLIFKFLANPKSEAKSVTEWAIIDPDHLKIVLSQLEYSAAELIRWSTQTTTPLTHSQLKTHAATAIKKFGSLELARKFWIQRSERMFQARSELKISLNKKLLAQDLILPWLEAV